ncbi:MAG: transcription antitermination factor NusB [Clostridiales bacterium]|nr:transcription antitermination factor NusB [Clostridiales bacterium]
MAEGIVGPRTLGRIQAMRALYQEDVGGPQAELSLDYLIQQGRDEEDDEEEGKGRQDGREGALAFAQEIVAGVRAARPIIDDLINRFSKDWPLGRIAPVERNILRIAIWELLYQPQTPRSVVIHEALEMAKTYGGADSSRYIHGVLGQVARTLEEERP